MRQWAGLDLTLHVGGGDSGELPWLGTEFPCRPIIPTKQGIEGVSVIGTATSRLQLTPWWVVPVLGRDGKDQERRALRKDRTLTDDGDERHEPIAQKWIMSV